MKEAFIQLLSKAKILENDSDKKNLVFEKSALVPKNIVYRTYKKRSELNQIVPKDLVKNIEDFQQDNILLTLVKDSVGQYLMFTDKEANYLIGVTDYLSPDEDSMFKS
ncbi:MAG: hypothetical protein Q8941_12955 [Bacteroidota bacterium]|nr:hypothetical protein [Bacteroidota bacterium]